MACVHLLALVFVIYLILPKLDGKIIRGHLRTSSDFVFLGRFCFESNGKGSLQYKFTYKAEECCYKLLLFNDAPGQWDHIRKNEKKMSCTDKKDLIPDTYDTRVTLGDSNSGCHRENVTMFNERLELMICEKFHTVTTVKERWWYFVMSNCYSPDGITIEYEMTLTNGDSVWDKHLSADESHILETDLTFMIVYIIVLLIVQNITRILSASKLLHTTYKMFVCSLFAEFMGVLGLFSSYMAYAEKGIENYFLKFLANLSSAAGVLLFTLMIILVSKGYTVTRGTLSRKSFIKISVFMTLYCLTYLTLYIYEATMFDPRDVLYKYQSPAGYGLIVLNFIGDAVWMYYTIGITLKHYPSKTPFYFRFALIYSGWWLATPITIFICNYGLPESVRAKVVNAMERSVIFLGHIFFLILTRPSAANQNFPFHIKTTQIGVLKDVDSETYAGTHVNYTVESDVNFYNMFVTDPNHTAIETTQTNNDQNELDETYLHQ
ncbi:transmembrane protein 145-like [Glandiceps talaboti]